MIPSELQKILEANAFEQIFAEILSGPATNDQPTVTKASQTYLSYIVNEHGYIKIFGQQEPKLLQEVFTNVLFTAVEYDGRPTTDEPATKSVQGLKEHIVKEFQSGYMRGMAFDGYKIGQHNRPFRLFVFGNPGIGKTTFLHHMALQAAKGVIPLIPIFIRLNELVEEKLSIIDYIVREFDSCQLEDSQSFVQDLLKNGHALVLFDGLEECQNEINARNRLILSIEEFVQRYEKCCVVMTGRKRPPKHFRNFNEVEMMKVNPSLWKNLPTDWFANNQPKLERFLQTLNESKNRYVLGQIISSPLDLALLCIKYDALETIPPDRLTLYENAFNVILEDRNHSRISHTSTAEEVAYKNLSVAQKNELIGKLAYQSFKKSKQIFQEDWLIHEISEFLSQLTDTSAKYQLGGDVLLKEIVNQLGVLVERPGQRYSFFHSTFQEYFAACYIKDNVQNGILEEITKIELIQNPQWKEVLFLVAEMLPQADEFIQLLSQELKKFISTNTLGNSLAKWIVKRSGERPMSEWAVFSRFSYLSLALTWVFDEAVLKVHAGEIDLKLAKAYFLLRELVHPISFSRQSTHRRFYRNRPVKKRQLTDAERGVMVLGGSPPPPTDEDIYLRSRNGSIFGGLAGSLIRAMRYADAFAPNRENSHRKGSFDPRKEFSKAMLDAKIQSGKIGWSEIAQKLNNIKTGSKNRERKEFNVVYDQFKDLIEDVVLDGWRWELGTHEDIVTVENWLAGHAILYECIKRSTLKKIDLEEFEDQHLLTTLT